MPIFSRFRSWRPSWWPRCTSTCRASRRARRWAGTECRGRTPAARAPPGAGNSSPAKKRTSGTFQQGAPLATSSRLFCDESIESQRFAWQQQWRGKHAWAGRNFQLSHVGYFVGWFLPLPVDELNKKTPTLASMGSPDGSANLESTWRQKFFEKSYISSPR